MATTPVAEQTNTNHHPAERSGKNKKARFETSSEIVFRRDGLLQDILAYIPNTYRFTAAANKRFHHHYLIVHGDDDEDGDDARNNDDESDDGDRGVRTSIRIALQAVETARLWAAEQDRARFPCDVAAQYGPLAVLQDLRLLGRYNWSSFTCAWAADHGRLDVLIWAREHGCPWDWMTCAWAKMVI
jgi:hypothetical protein